MTVPPLPSNAPIGGHPSSAGGPAAGKSGAGAPRESVAERALGVVILFVFWTAFASLASGLALFVAVPGEPTGELLLRSGLLGLLLMPILRVLTIVATAARQKDRMTVAATLTVLGILLALTIRDAFVRR